MYDVRPVTTPHNTACGPASLKMLLSYYGADVSLDALIEECDVRVNGCSGRTLLLVGRAHGLDMRAWQMGAEELIRQDRPAIIHWRYQHWCVFCGRDAGGSVWICNPSRGRYRVDPDTFAAMYSGIALFNGVPVEFAEDYFGEHAEEPDYFDK